MFRPVEDIEKDVRHYAPEVADNWLPDVISKLEDSDIHRGQITGRSPVYGGLDVFTRDDGKRVDALTGFVRAAKDSQSGHNIRSICFDREDKSEFLELDMW